MRAKSFGSLLLLLFAGGGAANAQDPLTAANRRGQTPFFYGENGERVDLDLSTEKIGVTFRNPMRVRQIEQQVGLDPRLYRPGVDQRQFDDDMGRSVVLKLTDRQNAESVASVALGLLSNGDVEAVHPVYQPIGRDGASRSGDSLLTNYISVVVSASTPRDQVLAMFAEDAADIISTSDYSLIGKIGYRIRIDADIASTRGDDALTIANRYHESPLVLHATPNFAPLYQVMQSPLEPNDPRYRYVDEDPIASGNQLEGPLNDPRWYWWKYDANDNDPSGINAAEAWFLAYGNWGPTGLGAATEIVVAALDNGVTFDYGGFGNPTNGVQYKIGTLPPQDLEGHNDINGRLWQNTLETYVAPPNPAVDDDHNGYIDDRFGWDFAGVDPTAPPPANGPPGDYIPFPDEYDNPIFNLAREHGTKTASVTAADTNNSVGIPGICPSCKIMPIRFHVSNFNEDPVDYSPVDLFFAGRAEMALRYAADNGAEVESLMMLFETYDPLIHTAIQYARAKGLVICAPAGNFHLSLDARPQYPASLIEVITAGASDPYGERAYFEYYDPAIPTDMRTAKASSYGWAVDVMVPSSGSINPLNPTQHTKYGFPRIAPVDFYTGELKEAWIGYDGWALGSGTSSAVPQISGVAGLMLTVEPRLSHTEIQFGMMLTANDLEYDRDNDGDGVKDDEHAGVGRDYYTGYGLVDMADAVDWVKKTKIRHWDPDTDSVLEWRVPDSNRPGGERSIMSLTYYKDLTPPDPDMPLIKGGDLFIEGKINTNATDTELTAEGKPGEWVWTSGGVKLARLDPDYITDIGLPSDFAWPTLHLKGTTHIYSNGTPPSGSKIFSHQDPVYGTIIDGWINPPGDTTAGDFYMRGRNYRGAEVDGDRYNETHIRTVGPGGTANGYEYSEITDVLTDTINPLQDGDIIQVWPRSTPYAPITFPTPAKSVVIRSAYPNDPTTVATTIIQAGPGQRAVTFSGNETADSALIGFTIQGDGSPNSGGIYGDNTHARILYNLFINNKRTGDGGAINSVAGLIEGNRFGATGQGNQAQNGGALIYCDGTVRKNWFEENFATNTGGAAYECDGTIVQNFFYKNNATVNGGALANCDGYILSNVLASNWCSSGNGGAMQNCDAIQIEQNTIFKNYVYGSGNRAGGIANSAVTGNFRNNILWGNTKNGPPPPGTSILAQLYNSSTISYSCVELGSTANNNIASDPLFVSTTFVPPTYFEDTFSNSQLDSWTNAPNSSFSDNGSYLRHDKSTNDASPVTNQVYVGALMEETRHIWFSYMRETDSEANKAATVHFRWANWPDTIGIKILPTSIILFQTKAGTTTTLGTKTVNSDTNKWYEITIISEGPYVQIWRAEPGNAPELLLQDGVDHLAMNRFYFSVEHRAHFRFDDVSWRSPANLEDFLKLSSGSPCLDRGQTDLQPTFPFDPVPFNDFDDHMGPLDAPDPEPGKDPLIPNDAPEREMGADEFTTGPGFVYWWKNL